MALKMLHGSRFEKRGEEWIVYTLLGRSLYVYGCSGERFSTVTWLGRNILSHDKIEFRLAKVKNQYKLPVEDGIELISWVYDMKTVSDNNFRLWTELKVYKM